jgi:diguanylate cyclase (GGDEF)-like protein
MTISEIARNTLKKLQRENKPITPDFFSKAFCQEAKLHGVLVEDCEGAAKYIKRLNFTMQKELANYKIRTEKEFIAYLIGKVTRSKPQETGERVSLLYELVSVLLNVMMQLHNKQAGMLAKQSKQRLDISKQNSDLADINSKWKNFSSDYDTSFLEPLMRWIKNLDTSDLKTMVGQIENSHKVTLQKVPKDDRIEKVVEILTRTLLPSIVTKEDTNIGYMISLLRKTPEKVFDKDIQKDLLEAATVRIRQDQEALKTTINTFDNIVESIYGRLEQVIEKSEDSSSRVKEIKNDIHELAIVDEVNVKQVQTKLLNIADMLESESMVVREDFGEHMDTVKKLEGHVELLQKELTEARAASYEDYLTQIYNKRGLEEHMKHFEASYRRHNRDYAIVMLDIDFFKKVNDLYGHDVGDAILSGFAKVLQKNTRQTDVIGRFGGEEFLILAYQKSLKDAMEFVDNLLDAIREQKFVVRQDRVHITASAGIALRSDATSLESATKLADEALYKAKRSGRDQAIHA